MALRQGAKLDRVPHGVAHGTKIFINHVGIGENQAKPGLGFERGLAERELLGQRANDLHVECAGRRRDRRVVDAIPGQVAITPSELLERVQTVNGTPVILLITSLMTSSSTMPDCCWAC